LGPAYGRRLAGCKPKTHSNEFRRRESILGLDQQVGWCAARLDSSAAIRAALTESLDG